MEHQNTPHLYRKCRSKRKGTGRISINMNISLTAGELAKIDEVATAHRVARSAVVRTLVFNNLHTLEHVE